MVVGFLLACVVALFAAAWFALPAGTVAAAGPLVALSLVSLALVLPLTLLYRIHQRLLDRDSFSSLRESSGSWARAVAARLGLWGMNIASTEKLGSAYHPASRTVLLREQVHAQHTVRCPSSPRTSSFSDPLTA